MPGVRHNSPDLSPALWHQQQQKGRPGSGVFSKPRQLPQRRSRCIIFLSVSKVINQNFNFSFHPSIAILDFVLTCNYKNQFCFRRYCLQAGTRVANSLPFVCMLHLDTVRK